MTCDLTKETTNQPTDGPTETATATLATPITGKSISETLPNTSTNDSDDALQSVILFGALAAALMCLLCPCCVILWTHKKLSNKSIVDQQRIQIGKDEDRIIMSNALVANIVIGEYDDDTNADSSYLETDSVIDDMKQFANDFGYQYLSMNDKRYWTKQEILSFLRDDVGAKFFDEFSTPKYDGLIVGITSYGDERDIMMSDGELMDKVAIHRVISNQYAAIRDFARIFIFDLCDIPESLKISMSMSGEHTVFDTVSTAENTPNEIPVGCINGDIGKGADFVDVRRINEWAHNTKNPDYNLVTIDAVGDSSTSNVIHCFTERVRQNAENQEILGLTDVMDHIRAALRLRGGCHFVPVLNNKTPMMIITKKGKK